MFQGIYYMSTKLAILSDTHGLLRPEVLEKISGCDAILHAGDINNEKVLDTLSAMAPIYVVRGNNDKDWAERLSNTLRFSFENVSFFMVHDKKYIPKGLSGVDVVIYGHSHKYSEQIRDGILYLNPGSCGKRRFDQEITFAIMTIDDSGYSVEKIVIPHTAK